MEGGLFGGAEAGVARVALPVPVDRLFEYALPAELAGAAAVGHRVRVRAGGRLLTGVVVELAAEPGEEARERLRPVEAVLDGVPAIAPSLLAVLREEARRVLCPVGIALAAALPAGSAPRTARLLGPTERGRRALASGALRPEARRVLAAVADRPLGLPVLRRRLGPGADALAEALERDGLLHGHVAVTGPALRAAEIVRAAVAPGVEVAAACEADLARAPRQAELLRLLAHEGPRPTRELARRLRGAAGLLRALESRGLVVRERSTPDVAADALPAEEGEIVPTDEQAAACEAIAAAVRGREATTFLLHGVTGSGKTEVYLRVVAEALAHGRQALVLVPEITLTHQILGRLRARFGDRLAVLHSGLRPSERLAQWERLRRGETPIAVGARSALFAPTRDLGLIVLDEEHDAAYKNEEGFRYHARALAMRRARADGCPVVLGSATPSLESRRATDTGRAVRLRLARRVAGRPLPAVELVDLVRERARLPRGRKLVLSGTLARALRQTLAEGGQAILFLNRRGFSTQIACDDCGYVARCKHCDIALTYHAAVERLRCHYCDYQEAPPEVCPGCGSPSVMGLGLGTERLEEEVRALLPEARVQRLDRDVSARRGATAEVLAALRGGEVDVLVGTQMVAKGHDFPGVRLVGVVNADLGLHLPDFRAAERTFQLLTQVAGRAGRGAAPGRVVVQTFSPDHYALRPVVDHDYERFYAEELRQRAALGYPPFGHLGLVRVSAEDEGLARVGAERLARAAREAAGAGDRPVEVLGPAPAPIARLRGRHRQQLVLKHPSAERLREVARAVDAARAELPGDVRASLDLQPVDML